MTSRAGPIGLVPPSLCGSPALFGKPGPRPPPPRHSAAMTGAEIRKESHGFTKNCARNSVVADRTAGAVCRKSSFPLPQTGWADRHSMRRYGVVNPALIDPKGTLIVGHGRILAARQLGLTVFPVIVLDHLTETEARELRLADNKIAENATWDD